MKEHAFGIFIALSTFLFGSGVGFTVGVLNYDLFDVKLTDTAMHRPANSNFVGK